MPPDYTVPVSRVKRLLTTNRIFFVTVNLRKSRPVFSESEFPIIISAMEESRRKLSFRLCGYVLMPDHWHALIGVSDPLTISRAVQDIKWIAARRIGRQRNSAGPLWQHQFWDRYIRNEREFGDRLSYLHLNPVRKGLVTDPAEWAWSSYNNFALDKSRVAQCPIKIDYVEW